MAMSVVTCSCSDCISLAQDCPTMSCIQLVIIILSSWACIIVPAVCMIILKYGLLLLEIRYYMFISWRLRVPPHRGCAAAEKPRKVQKITLTSISIISKSFQPLHALHCTAIAFCSHERRMVLWSFDLLIPAMTCSYMPCKYSRSHDAREFI